MCSCRDLRRLAGRPQVATRREPFVDVGHLTRLVLPGRAHEPLLVDEECASSCDVAEAAKLETETAGADDFPVEVGQKTEVQIERLRPRDVRPGRVARD